MILHGAFAQIKCSNVGKALNFMPSQEVRLHERMLIAYFFFIKKKKNLATSYSIQDLSSSPTSPPLIWGNKNLCPGSGSVESQPLAHQGSPNCVF